jgi:hypothetical protein
MEVTIGFARADFERLLHEVSPESPSYTILRRCPELDRWASEKPFSMCVVVECNQEEAMQLLEAAKQHCPQAVADIEYGFKSRGVFILRG